MRNATPVKTRCETCTRVFPSKLACAQHQGRGCRGVVDFDREVATEAPIICREAPRLRDADASDARESRGQELPASVVQLNEVLSGHEESDSDAPDITVPSALHDVQRQVVELIAQRGREVQANVRPSTLESELMAFLARRFSGKSGCWSLFRSVLVGAGLFYPKSC